MVELSPTTTYLADANLFIKAGTPQREASKALSAFFTRERWTLLIHPAVEDELSAADRTYSRHRTLERALADDWAWVIDPPEKLEVPHKEIETAARECIAEKTNRSVDQIEETDVKLVSLAANLLESGQATDVGIITNDQAAGKCFDNVLGEFGYESAEFIDAGILLAQVKDWYDSM
jgi:hypothetical protein